MGVTALWTAAHYHIPLLVVVANNRSSFNDELHQERMARARNRPVENKWIGQRMSDPEVDLAAMGRARANFAGVKTENIVALCDVDHVYAAETFKKYPQAKVYSDFREMLDKDTSIDAVMIAVQDHWHALIATAAGLASCGKNTPLLGRSLPGLVVLTVAGGRVAYAEVEAA